MGTFALASLPDGVFGLADTIAWAAASRGAAHLALESARRITRFTTLVVLRLAVRAIVSTFAYTLAV